MNTRLLVTASLMLSVLLCNQFICRVSGDTLGPLSDWMLEEYGSSNAIKINSPQNTTYSTDEILLNITLITYSNVYDVGFKVDDGEIERLSNLTIVETVPAPTSFPPYVKITCVGNSILTDLSEGNHTIIVYYGFQYEGINKRYEVTAREYVAFIIDKQTDIPEFPSWIVLPVFLILTLGVVGYRRKFWKQSRINFVS